MPHQDTPSVRRTISLPLFVGFTVTATGGPLALAALFVPGSVSSLSSIGLISVLGALVFLVPVWVWLRYSEHVVSAGGLFSFVEAAAGRPAALAQAAVWIVSYALYLPYTIDYITYDIVSPVLPGVKSYRPVLEIILPTALAALGFIAVRNALRLMTFLAIAQTALVVLFAIAGLSHGGGDSHSFGAHGSSVLFAKGTGNLSLLFICSNLSLFLGSEVERGGQTVRRGLALGFGVAALAVVLGTLSWARAGRAELNAPVPGASLAQDAWGHWFGIVVGLGVAASVAGVVIAEYFALNRLVHALIRRPLEQVTSAVALFFVATSVVALINPSAFYTDLIKPSLIALWVSQLAVFVVYPRFAVSRGMARGSTYAATAFSLALMGYGLYTGLTLVTGS